MPEVLTSNLSTNTSAEENRNSALINLASITGIGGLSYYAATKYGQAGSPIADAYQNLLGTDYLNRHLDKSKTWTDSQGHIFMPQSVKRSMLSQLMALEEASPLHILRTLQLSNIVSPFSDLTSNDQQVLFSSRKLKNQQHYYESLIRFANKDMEDKLKAAKVEEALRNGMIYQNGKMFGIKDGKADLSNVIIKDARLSLAGTKIGSVVSPNQMHSNFAKTVGSTFDLDRVGDDYLSIVGGKDLKNFSNKWGQSWLRYSVEMGMKSLDNPLAGFEEMLRGVGVDQTSFFETKTWNTLKKYTNVQLGTGGDYDLSIKKSLLVSGKNVAIKSTKVALGYEIADSVLRTLSPEGGLFNDGIYTGLTNLYASSRVKFAEVWSDKFQGYKDSQENNAEGSTSLTTLMALPMAGALFGSQVAYLKRMGKTLTTNSEEAGKIYNTAAKSELLSAVGLNKDYKPMKRNALIGALAGATLAAPFLPGALVGDSSKELKERYSGEKEVAQKANRWWVFGSCLPSDQEIYTQSGIVFAKDIKIGDQLKDRYGRYNPVTALFERPVNEPIFNIKVVGAKSIDNRFTGNHPILTNGGWKNTEDVVKGDVLVAPKFKVSNNYIFDLTDKIPRTVTRGDFIIPLQTKVNGELLELNNRKYKRLVKLTPTLGLLFGWFLAEGSISQNNLVEFVYHKSEETFAKNMAEFISEEFNTNYTIEVKNANTRRLRISSKYMCNVLKLFFYSSIESTFKQFPDLSNTNEEFIKNFVIGLYYGDGSIDRQSSTGLRSKIKLTTSKLDHVLGLKNLLTYWDIYPYVLKEVRKSTFPNGSSGIYTSYRVVAEGLNSYTLTNTVGVYKELYKYEVITKPTTTKQPNYWFDDQHLYLKVTDVTKENYQGLVHDFTVELSHEFQVTSFIVHNSSWEGSHTQYFAQDKVARIRADSTDKVRYGDDDTKKRLNPLLHPLAYLRDPYRYEKMHEKDMPYPVWGMDVSYGSIYGKIFERTIGQVIKPDIINPAIYDLDDITPSTGKLGLIKRLLIGDKESRSGTIQVPHSVSPDDRGLINAGILAPEASAGYDPKLESAGLVYQAGTDLIGLKGWTASLPLSAIGIDPGNIRPQLSRSGEATSAARDLVDTNMGDLFGFGEFQRKILGTSSGSLAERENPMKNNMAYWLPSKDNQYYINFTKGNPYSKIKNGEDRLPGAGYQSLHPNEIKEGTDPNDYALIHRYKILADVAKGSREHIRAKQQLIEAYQKGDLSKYEENILTTTMEQEKSRDQRKTFYEDKSTRERVTLGPVGFLQSLLWDNIARHGESPTEMLTPIRPMAKFMHKRTAIQDYVETQLGGSDAAIWTNPYSHFIKPALNKTRLIAQGDFKATEVKDKENINEFFDKLGHIRNRANGSPSDDSNSVVASSLSGLNTKEKVLKFKKSLSDDEKDYFESFSKETDEGKRDKIRSILPKDVLRGYEQIWQNIDTARKARSQGVSVQQAIAEDTDKRTTTLSKAFNVKLSNSEKNAIKLKVSKDKDDYVDLGYSTRERIRMSQNDQLRLKMADKEAMTYVDRATGIPNKKFIGWDPRLKTDDIKIRTLSVGGEDLKRFGFWKSDEERMNRIPILKSDEQIVQNLDKIKSDIRNNIKMRQQIEQALFGSGFKSSRIDLTSSPIGNLQIEER